MFRFVPLLCALWVSGGRLAAQSDPRLVGAMRLAQEGLSDSARATVARLLARTEPTDTLYPQILYTRALLAADPREMRTDLQRVAVEYASSNWADDALLRLALLEYAGGQLDASARNLEQIALDHSASPLYARAAYWAGRVYFDLRRPDDACRWLRAGRERAGEDLELRAQLAAYADRCAATPAPAAAPTDTAAAVAAGPIAAPAVDSAPAAPTAAAPPAAEPAPPPVRTPAFRIQIAAVNTQAAADSIAVRARTAGTDTVLVVREAPYYKVRVGSYPSRAAAVAALPDARKRFRGTPFVVVDRE
jgi:cell division septation protein DedD